MKILSNIIIVGAKPIVGMKSLGAVSNMSLVGKKTVLDIQLQNLNKRFICDNIVYVGGHMGDKIVFPSYKNQHISYVYNPEYDDKNNGYSLKLVLEHLTHPNTLILFNKTIFNYKIFDSLIKNPISSIFVDNSPKNTYRIGCNLNQNTGLVNNLFYGLNNKTCGIYFLQNDEHVKFKNTLLYKKNIDNNFIFEIINDIIEDGGRFQAINIKNKLIKQIDSVTTLKNTIRYYAKNFST
jgi:choline kinase